MLGEKHIFITAEPDQLNCIDKSDGTVRWSVPITYDDLPNGHDKDQPALAAELKDVVHRDRNELAALEEALENAPSSDQVPQDEQAEMVARQETLAKQLPLLETRFDSVSRYVKPGTNPNTGYASATPVTDGRHVWVVFGYGIAACYDMDGAKQWISLTEWPVRPDFGHSSSPLLVGNLLVFHMNDLVALEASTGKERWRTKTPPLPGTPVLAKAGDEPLIVTPDAAIIRAADGAVLAHVGDQEEWVDVFNTPIVHGGVAWFICSMNGDACAVELPKHSEPFAPHLLWKNSIDEGSHYYGSPLYHEGLIYTANEQSTLFVLDAATGTVLFSQDLELGITFPSIALAGNHLFVSGQGGTTVVFEPGSTPREIGRNKVEKFRSCPVFHGNRLYLRTYKNLYCFGREQP